MRLIVTLLAVAWGVLLSGRPNDTSFDARRLSAVARQELAPPPGNSQDFPSRDQAIWAAERRGLVAKLAARRLAQAPGASQTVALLLEAGRHDDGVTALARTVTGPAGQIADAFAAVSRWW